MYGKSQKSSSSPETWENSGGLLLKVRCRAWRRAWLSSLEAPLATRGSHWRPVTPVSSMVVAVDGTVLCARLGGAPRVQLTVVLCRSRSVRHPRVFPMPAEGSAVEEGSRSWQYSGGNSIRHVRTGCRRFPQDRSSARNGGTVAGVDGRDPGHTHCATWRRDAV
mgnify:CR=1 FL=1